MSPDTTPAPASARALITKIDETISALQDLRVTITEALVRAHRDADAGFGAGGTYEAVSQSSVPDRATAGRALSHWRGGEDDKHLQYVSDRVRVAASGMVAAVGQSHHCAELARRAARALLPLARDRAASLLAEVEGAPAYCANCGIQVWRTKTDRLLSGRCRNCYEYRRMHDGRERPRELCDADLHRKSPETRPDSGRMDT